MQSWYMKWFDKQVVNKIGSYTVGFLSFSSRLKINLGSSEHFVVIQVSDLTYQTGLIDGFYNMEFSVLGT